MSRKMNKEEVKNKETTSDDKSDNIEKVNQKKIGKKAKFLGKYSKRFGKYSFVAWIIYQSVKGTLTLTFIWAPMIYYWFTHR